MYSMYKYFTLIIVSIFLLINFGCSNNSGDGDGDDNNNGSGSGDSGKFPSTIVLNKPKALFVSKGSATSMSISRSNTTRTGGTSYLFQVLQNDSIEEVSFTDESGNEISMNVYQTSYLSNRYVGLLVLVLTDSDNSEEGSAAAPPKSIIIDIDTGKIHDFSGYALFSEGYYFSVPAIINGKLYVLSSSDEYGAFSDGTLYRVNLETMVAEPMNNPEFLNITRFYHISNGDFLVYDNITAKIYVLRSDGSTPDEISAANYSALGEMDDLSGGDGDLIQLMYDKNGNLFDFDSPFDINLGSVDINYLSFSVDSSGLVVTSESVVADQGAQDKYNYIILSSNYLYDKSRVMVIETGYVLAEQNAAGGFSHTFTAKDLSSLFSSTVKNLIWKGTTCFYTDGSSIWKWDIAGEAAATEFISQEIISMWIIGDYLYYTKYIDATNVETWKIDIVGTEASSKVSTSNMEIQDIVELTL